jgi:hypothetical protein
MNIPHEKFCVLPWVSLETSPIGTVRPCCLAEEEIVDDTGTKFDLNTAEFGKIQRSAYMQDLRQQFWMPNNHRLAANAGVKKMLVVPANACIPWIVSST